MFGLVIGLVFAFYYSWRTSLVALACVPFMIASGIIQNKIQLAGSTDTNDAFGSNKFASDAIINFKTVASLGYTDKIVEDYAALLKIDQKTSICKAHSIGITFGFSQFAQFATNALVFYFGFKFAMDYPDSETFQGVFKAIFAIMFGAFAAANA